MVNFRKILFIITIMIFIIILSGCTKKKALCEDGSSSGLEYTLVNDTYTVSGLIGGNSEIIIPSTYRNKPVTIIGKDAFKDTNIFCVKIPKSITIIDERAFYDANWLKTVIFAKGSQLKEIKANAFYATSLSKIDIPDSVTKIEDEFFNPYLKSINVSNKNQYFSSLDGVLFNKDQTILLRYPEGKFLKIYTVPNTVITINNYAFYDVHSINKITIPKSVEVIEDFAFSRVNNLNEIIFESGSNLKQIDSYVFRDTALTSISLPGRLTYLSFDSLSDIPKLEEINVDGDHFHSIDGVLFNKEKTKLIKYPEGKTDDKYTIPNTVSTIELFAFENVYYLEAITISNNIKSIPFNAFYATANLSIINFETNSQLETIEEMAFNNIINLEMITIPSSVSFIGEDAFINNPKLKLINVSTENKYFSSENGVLFTKDQTTLIKYPEGKTDTAYIIPSTVSYIEDNAFFYPELESITILSMDPPNNFLNNLNDLTKIYVPKNAYENYKNDSNWSLDIESIYTIDE